MRCKTISSSLNFFHILRKVKSKGDIFKPLLFFEWTRVTIGQTGTSKGAHKLLLLSLLAGQADLSQRKHKSLISRLFQLGRPTGSTQVMCGPLLFVPVLSIRDPWPKKACSSICIAFSIKIVFNKNCDLNLTKFRNSNIWDKLELQTLLWILFASL